MLVIDKAKYFNFQIDDIDARQQKPKVMDAAMREAAYGLSREVDTELAKIHTSTPADNKVGSDGANAKLGGVLTAGSAMYDYLVDLKVKLDENNCPDDGQRWVVVPRGLWLPAERQPLCQRHRNRQSDPLQRSGW